MGFSRAVFRLLWDLFGRISREIALELGGGHDSKLI